MNKYIVGIIRGHAKEGVAFDLEVCGATILCRFSSIRLLLIEAEEETLESLQAVEGVEFVEAADDPLAYRLDEE